MLSFLTKPFAKGKRASASAPAAIKLGSTRQSRRNQRAAAKASRSARAARAKEQRLQGLSVAAGLMERAGDMMGFVKIAAVVLILGLLALAFLAGCASGPMAPPNLGTWDDPHADVKPAVLPGMYQVRDGKAVPVTMEAAAKTLATNADVVFFGELHGHGPSHAAEFALLSAFAKHKRGKMAFSVEQWERDTQVHVDAFMANEISAAEFLEKSRPWPNWKDYWPLVREAKNWGIPMIAGNIPRRYASMVFRQGPDVIATLPAVEQAWCARKITTDDGEYKERFFQFAGRRDENFFAAQAIKDDTMAESIVAYMDAKPWSFVFHINGRFHSDAGLGVVERVAARRPFLRLKVVTTVPSVDGTIPADAMAEGDFLLVTPPPAPTPAPARPRPMPPSADHGKSPESKTADSESKPAEAPTAPAK